MLWAKCFSGNVNKQIMDSMYQHQQALQQSAAVAANNLQRKSLDVENEQLTAQHCQTQQSIISGAVAPAAGAFLVKGVCGLAKRYVGPIVGDVAEKIAAGDVKGGSQTGVQGGIDSLVRTLGNRFGTIQMSPLSEDDLDLADVQPAPISPNKTDFQSDPIGATTDVTGEPFEGDSMPSDLMDSMMRLVSSSAQAGMNPDQFAAMINPSNPASSPKTNDADGDWQMVEKTDAPSDLADAAVSDATQGAKIAETAFETDAALGGPEDPIGDIAALVVGLGGLFGSIFGVHKPSTPQTPQIAPLNPSSQFGV